MYPNLRNAFWLTVLVGGAIATFLLGRTPEADDSATEPASSVLGYYMTRAVLTGTDENGETLYLIAADRIEEDPESGQLLLDAIEVRYRDEREVPWRIRATAGRGPATREYFDLTGGVSIERETGPDEQPESIQAESLRFEPESYLATTSGPVRVVLGESAISGIGLKAHLKDGRIDLESEVHAEFH